MPLNPSSTKNQPRVAILGAGPIGLEAALAAAEAGVPFKLFEASPAVAGCVRQWGHVRLFTSWALSVSPRTHEHLPGLPADPNDYPLGRDLVERVLEPLARLDVIGPHLQLDARVVSVGRKGLLKHEEIGTPQRAQQPFRLLVQDARGRESVHEADVVLDCTGSYTHPNCLGDGGIPAVGERTLQDSLRHDIPDFDQEEGWLGQTTLVLGKGHSAQTAVRDLASLVERQEGPAKGRSRILWAIRQESPSWEVIADDPLPERARLTGEAAALANGGSPAIETIPGVAVEALARSNGRIEVTLRHRNDTCHSHRVDRILALTGRVGEHLMYRQLQVHECYATSGPMKLAAALLGSHGGDCMAQTSHGVDSLTNPEPGFFILGSKSYGRNNTFLLRVGWDQVREVFEVVTQ